MVEEAVAYEAPATTATFTNANCSAGYEIIFETLCFSNTTGDVVFAEEAPMQTAKN